MRKYWLALVASLVAAMAGCSSTSGETDVGNGGSGTAGTFGGTSSGGSAQGGSSGGSACGACTGCCSGTTCLEAPSQTAASCGRNGSACGACSSGEICANGQCIVDTGECSPATCPAGCCSAGACILSSQMDWTACGGGGGAECSACSWGVACAGGSCTTEIDASAFFFIAVESVHVSGSWDIGTSVDPYVCFSDGTNTGCSTWIGNSPFATWEGGELLADASGDPVSFSGAAIRAGQLSFAVWDDDDITSDELIQEGGYSEGIDTKQARYNTGEIGNLNDLVWRLDP